MTTLLIPVDGSDYSLKAVDYAVYRARESKTPIEVHLLNVQMALASVNVKLFVSAESLESYYRDEGHRALEVPLARAKSTGLTVTPHIGVGDPAKIIIDYVAEKKADEIIRNTYRTLMSRGMKGCYVWFVDAAAADVLRQRLPLDAKEDAART